MPENPATHARARTRNHLDPMMQARFIDMLYDGMTRDQAARAVGSTGTKFRALCRRDKAFRELAQDAETSWREQGYQHKIRYKLDEVAFNDRHQGQMRALQVIAEANLPELEHKRVSRIGNAKGEELQIGANARISAEQLAALPDEVLERLLEAKAIERALERGETIPLRAIEGGRVDGVNEHA